MSISYLGYLRQQSVGYMLQLSVGYLLQLSVAYLLKYSVDCILQLSAINWLLLLIVTIDIVDAIACIALAVGSVCTSNMTVSWCYSSLETCVP